MGSSKAIDWDEMFLSAALEPDQWLQALENMASHTGSSHGQLIGIGGERDVSFNLVTQFDRSHLQRSMDMGGVQPDLNFRIAAAQREINRGHYDPIVYEKHYDAVVPTLASRVYADWCEEIGIPFGCQSNLVIDGFGLIGLAVLRSRQDGRTTAKDRATFARATQAARRAVRLQERLEGQQAKMLAGAFGAMGICAFLLDRIGRAVAHTSRAEELLSKGIVGLKNGVPSAAGNPMSLGDAVRALTAENGGQSHIRLQASVPTSQPPMLFEGFRLPDREWSFGQLPRAVIVANPPRGDRAGVTSFLIALYGLTPAEADIGLRLLDGKSRAMIASDRGVTLETLKGQIKALYLKCGVDGEASLMRLLAGIVA